MGSEVKASRAASAQSVSVGERVTVGNSNIEYVVVSVDHATGRLELLRLNPGRIESDVLATTVRKMSQPGPRLVSEADD